MSMKEERFKLVGGPCDGEVVTLPVVWDGLAYRPPEFVRSSPRLPLPEVVLTEVVAQAQPTTVETYYRHIFREGDRRWFEFRSTPQETT